MKMIDAWAVHEAVMHHACRADLTTREWRVLSAVLSRTLRWQKVRDRVARSLLVEKSGVGKGSIGATIQSLCDLGFLTYEPGRGRALSSVGVIVPEHWERWRGGREVPDSETSDVPESETPEASEPETTEVPASETSGVSKSGTAEVAEHETLTGGFDGRTSTGDRYGGGETGLVVLLPRAAEADAPPAPALTDAHAVVQAFCEVVAARGVPWTEPQSLQRAVAEALRHHDPRAVLVGLGMWEAEETCIPRQVPEWVRKAIRQGPVPAHLNNATALVDEGGRRYERYSARKTVDHPSKADERRLRSIRKPDMARGLRRR